jgi:hypothetical protein
MRIGRTGTPRTWWRNTPAISCRHEQRPLVGVRASMGSALRPSASSPTSSGSSRRAPARGRAPGAIGDVNGIWQLTHVGKYQGRPGLVVGLARLAQNPSPTSARVPLMWSTDSKWTCGLVYCWRRRSETAIAIPRARKATPLGLEVGFVPPPRALLQRFEVSEQRRHVFRHGRVDMHGPRDHRKGRPGIHHIEEGMHHLVAADAKNAHAKDFSALCIH